MTAATCAEETRARVTLGAALFDTRQPGWTSRTDLDILDMASGRYCIVGQLIGTYFAVLDSVLFPGLGIDGAHRLAVAHGFQARQVGDLTDYADYGRLRAAWVDEIEARRA